ACLPGAGGCAACPDTHRGAAAGRETTDRAGAVPAVRRLPVDGARGAAGAGEPEPDHHHSRGVRRVVRGASESGPDQRLPGGVVPAAGPGGQPVDRGSGGRAGHAGGPGGRVGGHAAVGGPARGAAGHAVRAGPDGAGAGDRAEQDLPLRADALDRQSAGGGADPAGVRGHLRLRRALRRTGQLLVGDGGRPRRDLRGDRGPGRGERAGGHPGAPQEAAPGLPL
ncbi:MAG: hypothetical protein AVDCRST_MAG41-3876, partial [uncultured Corynebacteriales bacterium]